MVYKWENKTGFLNEKYKLLMYYVLVLHKVTYFTVLSLFLLYFSLKYKGRCLEGNAWFAKLSRDVQPCDNKLYQNLNVGAYKYSILIINLFNTEIQYPPLRPKHSVLYSCSDSNEAFLEAYLVIELPTTVHYCVSNNAILSLCCSRGKPTAMLFKVQYKGKKKYIKLHGASHSEFLKEGKFMSMLQVA